MPILIDENSKIVVQGVGNVGRFYTQLCINYGSKIVGAVDPYRSGESTLPVPILDTLQDIKKFSHFNVTMIFVPGDRALAAIMEALEEEVELIICFSRNVPVHDICIINEAVKNSNSRLVGPDSCGVVSVDISNASIMPPAIFHKGKIGLISYADSLTYEAMLQLKRNRLGQSTCVTTGNSLTSSKELIELISLFERDHDTKGVFLILQVNPLLLQAIKWIKDNFTKPLGIFVIDCLYQPLQKREFIKTLINEDMEIVKNFTSIGDAMLNKVENRSSNSMGIYDKNK